MISISRQGRLQSNLRLIWKEKMLYALLLPGILYYILFVYKPMWGVLIAFQDYSVTRGILGSKWVGLEHFRRFFSSIWISTLFRNTLMLAVLNLIFYFPAPIILALLLNEVRNQRFKRVVQSMTYLPHFLSWVVIYGIFRNVFSVEGGVINLIVGQLGGGTIPFLTSPGWFRTLIILEIFWKEVGWGTIIFLAALAGVDVSLYEAAIVDGASHWRRLWHITLPGIRPTIVTLLILRMGSFLNTGYEQIFLMMNSANREVAEVFDTYVYSSGIKEGQLSYSTAVGLFKSVVGLLLILSADFLAKRVGEGGIL